MEELINYLDRVGIQYELTEEENILLIGNKTCYLSKGDDGILIDESFELIDVNYSCDWHVFKFGGKWYWSPSYEVKLNPLQYIFPVNTNKEIKTFLGVHGSMELMSGSRLYEDWVLKAKFLGIEALGICEANTLAGAVKFQLSCKKAGIKPILGMSFAMDYKGKKIHWKAYCKNLAGWENLLKINKAINIDYDGFIPFEEFIGLQAGLIFVIDTKKTDFSFAKELYGQYNYYTLDPVEFASTSLDNEYFENLHKFILSGFTPVAIMDAYYLEEEHAFVKPLMDVISKKSNIKQCIKQYFMNENEYRFNVLQLFNHKNIDAANLLLKNAFKNLNEISAKCDFTIPEMSAENRHLPAYKMTEAEVKKYGNQNKMIEVLIEEGLKRKAPKAEIERYRKQAEYELSVLDIGNVRNYFLILWDIINWSRKNGIIVGIGRGSAAGSLIAYLLDITRVNPFDYGLLFERFLNPGRVQASLPDIDVDFSGKRRDEVKNYIGQKYGFNRFCDVGTYTNLKPRSLIKELGKMEGHEHYILNDMTKFWSDGMESIEDLLRFSCKDSRSKQFIKKNPAIINDMELLLMQPKAESIHACATIIVPDGKEIHEYIPLKWMMRDGSKVLVSQWEGPELEAVGFLKEDILGVAQLDKYEMILQRIKDDTGEIIELDKIPLDDEVVMQYFSRGDNGDIFHFGSTGLSNYCREMKPETIHDLIAANALYRPGPMEQGFHKKFIKRKNGLEEITYYPQCEKITKETYGLLAYQEQIMLICQHVGGLTLTEADSIRKSMVKKDINSIAKFVDKFHDHAVNFHKIAEADVKELWDILVNFAKYGFNKSHAAAYSITAYYGQYLKHYYPLQFWATAFSFAGEDDYPVYLAEIFRSGNLEMRPPDINISGAAVVANKGTDSMYWSLTSIKGCGDKAFEQILAVRNKVGGFTSFEHFLKHNSWKANKAAGIDGTKVNKTVIEALISSGCFDRIEGIEQPSERRHLLEQYRTINKVKVDATKDYYTSENIEENWFWSMRQKELCGVANFDFEEIGSSYFGVPYIDTPLNITEANEYEEVNVIGFVQEVILRKTKKGDIMASVILEHNFETIRLTIWANDYTFNKALIDSSTGKILYMNGVVRFDSYNGCNVVYSSSDGVISVLS